MADISLKEYLEKVESLFQTGKYDEVVQHGRHILKHYPKNTPATRLLGRALVFTSEPQQAEMYLRRVLAVYPDDPVAHAALSDVNERLNKPNEAIWHMERALEQAPGVKAYVEKLRGLYQQHRNIDNPRFQLTTGAVARQYIRNGLYQQAIETLQATLDNAPRRVDLRLHLAQTLWEAGMQVEAAEEALDILDTLPYCLGANNLLTRLWLGEGRPSDAQRYLNQIQEVEPYVALRLAQDTTPDNNAFILPELDYRRVAESQLATSQPDWLSQVSTEDATLDDPSTEMTPDSFDEANTLTDLEAENILPPPSARPGHTGLLMALDANENDDAEAIVSDEMPDWLAEAAPMEETGGDENAITDLFADFDNLDAESTADEDDDLSWLEGDSAVSDEAAALDWMAETELGDSSELPDLFGELDDEADNLPTADVSDLIDDDPLAWMQEAGVELTDEVEPSINFAADLEEDIEFADPDNLDPLAWMQEAGVELTDTPATSDFFADEESPNEAELEDVDEALAWMHTATSEVAEELAEPDSLIEGGDELDWIQSSETNTGDDDESLEWLQTSDLVEPNAVSQVAGTLPENSDESDSLDWLSDDSMLDEFFDLESLSTDSPAPVADVPLAQAQNVEGWQDTMADENLPPASDSENSDDELSSFEWLDDSTESAENTPDWLSENLEESAPADLEADVPEWLSETDDNEEFGWLNEEVDPESSIETIVPAAEPNADMPDWLSEAAPTTSMGEEITAEPVAEIDDADSFDWIADSEDAEDEPAAELSSDMPDWLSEAAPTADIGEEIAAEPVAEMGDDDSFDWMSDSDTAEDQPAAEPATDMPDWLSEAAPTADIGEEIAAEPVAEMGDDDSFDWVSDGDAAEDEPAAEPATDMPDWLSEAAPTADIGEEIAAEPVAEMGDDDSFDWMSDSDAAEDQPAAEPATDMPDWLSEAAPTADIGEEIAAEPVAEMGDDDSFDWIADSEDAEDEPAAELSSDMPDWLSEAAPTADIGEEIAAEPVAEMGDDDSFDWIADSEDAEDEPAAELSSDMPDWLSEAAPTADIGEEIAAEPVAEMGDDDSFDWMSDSDAAEDQPAAEPATDMPDWLSEAAPTADIGEEIAAEPVAEMGDDDSVDWIADGDGADDEPAAEPATDMPDWLSEAAPVTDSGEEIAAEPVAEVGDDDSVDWIADGDDAEVEPAAELDEVGSDETTAEATGVPDWLSEVVPVEEATEETSIEDEERFEWPEENAQAVASEPPDWLSEVEAITDGDESEAVVSESVDDEPDWLSEADELEAGTIDAAETVADVPDWLSEAEDDAVQSEIQDAAAEEIIEEPAEIDGETRILSDTFDWEEQGEPEYTTDSSESEFGWVDEAEVEAESTEQLDTVIAEDFELEQTLAGASAPPPADNAPDWLNAMVPGLDLDYAAQEDDEPVESAYLEAPTTHREQLDVGDVPQDINWLTDIVDAETSPFEPITDVPVAKSRRFVFTRKPAWLRMLTERRSTSQNEDDDFELPEWLQ